MKASVTRGGATAHAGGHSLHLDRVTHRFGSFTAVNDITLHIAAGELVALLGPSGCGKTTLLRIIAGFIRQSEGHVRVDGAAMDRLAPNQRNVGIVFQNYALFPHMNVAQNVAYGLEARGWPRGRISPKVDAMLSLVQLGHLRDRLPRELSGGQQQRTAIARAMAVEPKILLLDEPFGALDKNLRLDMQIEVKRIQRELGITSILVTHDQEEALSMADRIAVINQGRMEQLSPPNELYDRPRSLFVNQFVGTTNLLAGTLIETADGRARRVRLAAGTDIDCDVETDAARGDAVWLSVRPEQVRLARSAQGTLPATVVIALPLGPSIVYEVRVGEGTHVKVTEPRAAGEPAIAAGEAVSLSLASRSGCAVFKRGANDT